MIDFKKKLGDKASKPPINPLEIYDTLDRASDKGDLRQAQSGVLSSWFESRRAQKDVLLKMHTGQGKTLVGLLILQSKLNEGKGPCLYLCPNNYLVDQTILQAGQFGIKCVAAEPDLPMEFLKGRAILVTSVQKLFNGLTRFGLDAKSTQVESIVIDDAHACIDTIRSAFTLQVERDSEVYKQLVQLFKHELELQGVGTFADIATGVYDALLPVPYWDWCAKLSDVASILSKNSNSNAVKFVWPLMRDILSEYSCLVSGASAEIYCELPSLDRFGSFARASHRVYMSATTADDSFLVKGLGLDPEVIAKPIHYEKEKWSGERMIVIPSLVSEGLPRSWVIPRFGKPQLKTDIGTVVLVPSFRRSNDWHGVGAIVAKSDSILELVDQLKDGKPGNRAKAIVFVNRYEGIDLPDNACRILILDGKPFSEGLYDRYLERCLGDSKTNARRTARSIEQGLGRAVRGEKDYCVVILTGDDLTQHLRRPDATAFHSPQTRRQIEIGLELADLAKQESKGQTPAAIVEDVIGQCLERDEGWKQYYAEEMKSTPAMLPADDAYLAVLVKERAAWEAFRRGKPNQAYETIQGLLDSQEFEAPERGLYLQHAARFLWHSDRARSQSVQRASYSANPNMLKPADGAEIPKTKALVAGRAAAIKKWIQSFSTYADLQIATEEMIGNLSFGVSSEAFEESLKRLGSALGFASSRPDREAKAGPDNLWCLFGSEYILFECKSEVLATRQEIHKSEAGQMEVSCAWFEKNYPGCSVLRALVIPADRLAKDAAVSHDIRLLRDLGLKTMKGNVRGFFAELKSIDLKSVDDKWVEDRLVAHHLDVSAIKNRWFTKLQG